MQMAEAGRGEVVALQRVVKSISRIDTTGLVIRDIDYVVYVQRIKRVHLKRNPAREPNEVWRSGKGARQVLKQTHHGLNPWRLTIA